MNVSMTGKVKTVVYGMEPVTLNVLIMNALGQLPSTVQFASITLHGILTLYVSAMNIGPDMTALYTKGPVMNDVWDVTVQATLIVHTVFLILSWWTQLEYANQAGQDQTVDRSKVLATLDVCQELAVSVNQAQIVTIAIKTLH